MPKTLDQKYLEIKQACRLGDAAIDRYFQTQRSFTDILVFAKRMAAERDHYFSTIAVELIMMAQSAAHDDFDLQNEVTSAFTAVIKNLPRNKRVYASMRLYRKGYDQLVMVNPALLNECEKALATELKAASDRCIKKSAGISQERPDSMECARFFCQLYLTYTVDLPPQSAIMDMFIEFYKDTADKLEHVGCDSAIIVDAALAQNLPEDTELERLAITNFSRHTEIWLEEISRSQDASAELEILENFIKDLQTDLPPNKLLFMQALRKIEKTLSCIRPASTSNSMPTAALHPSA